MGRPSKLNEQKWAEIGRRLALGGDGNTVTELAKEFKVSKTAISRRFSKQIATVQTLANTLAMTEMEIDRLPVPQQGAVRTLADQLKGIASSLALAANENARTAAVLAQAASQESQRILMPGGVVNINSAKTTAALLATSNEAGKLGMGLLTANKDKGDTGAPTLEDLVTGRKV